MPKTYEVEVKTLLGSKEKSDELKTNIARIYPNAQVAGKSTQLNHYFTGGDLSALYGTLSNILKSKSLKALKSIMKEGKKHSVRTRYCDGSVFIVIKASIDDTTSSNGIRRIEFERKLPNIGSINEIDELLLNIGFNYQAKWSREREEYRAEDMNICIDKNAGYGYVAEFEKIVSDARKAQSAMREIRAAMAKLGVEELPQDRLERMFAHYNKNWQEYYGTDKTFTID